MRRALAECIIIGPATTIPFHRQILEDPRFISGEVSTSLVESWLLEQNPENGGKQAGDAARNVHMNGMETGARGAIAQIIK